MKILFNKISKFILIAIVIVFSAAAISTTNNDFEISKNLEIFVDVFKGLHYNYVDEIQPGQLIKTAIDKMLESLDPYTTFIPESDMEDVRMMTTGQYGGIGSLIQQRDGYVIISEPYEGFPAQLAGLKAGDMILEINGESAKGKNASEVSSVLKGFPGSTLNIKIERPVENKQYEFEIKREDIKIKNVPFYTALTGKVGYIKLTNFTFGASSEVKNALIDLKTNNGVTSVILDLRGNGGGLLGEAINIVGLFVPKNTLVVKTQGKLKDSNKDYLTPSQPYDTQIPLVVLVDFMSASASEIVAGAIQDLDRGVIVGQQSYGKGLVQNIIQLSYNTRLKITIAKYYIPSGRCIQAVDYSSRDSLGRAKAISDQQKTIFYTKNKRPVYDAGGIIPDIEIEPEMVAKITISLVTKNLIFDYATLFAYNHSEIEPADQFEITDAIYSDFINFLSDKDYDYVTESEKKLLDLKKTAQEEKYFENIQTEFESLMLKMSHNKQEDLITFREEIAEFLGNEIISRYYFQKGRIQHSIKYDIEISEAVRLLLNPTLYQSILSGTTK